MVAAHLTMNCLAASVSDGLGLELGLWRLTRRPVRYYYMCRRISGSVLCFYYYYLVLLLVIYVRQYYYYMFAV